MSKTHWKKAFNPNYIGAWSLDENKDLIVTIKSAGKEPVMGSDGKEEECLVIHLEGQKPMICNKTNAKTISIVAGSPYLEEWAGKKIQLFVTPVRAFGETVPALRVRPVRPAEKKAITKDRFTKMVDAIKKKQFDKVRALADFALTEEQRKTISAL